MKKIGILGGTFNPPHKAHMLMAKAALEQGGMDEIILMPNGDPPHKKPLIAAEERLKMTELAAEELSREAGLSGRVRVSDIEIRSDGFSYLANTLEVLKAQLPEDELYFLSGGDAIASMGSWYGSERIFALVKILAFRRKSRLGLSIEPAVRYLEQQKGAVVTIVDAELPEISSTQIRARAAEGCDVAELTGDAVAAYIRGHEIYQNVTIKM